MRYVAAYTLSSLGGKTPSAKDIEKILDSVGVDCDAECAKKVVDQLKGKNVDDVIAEGRGKLGSVPVSAGSGAPAAAAASAGAAPAAKKEEKEVAKEEPEEESDEDMGFGLFD